MHRFLSQALFKRRLQIALAELSEKDKFLLQRKIDVNERTVTHRLALFLTPLFPIYDVDCEYNRMLEKGDHMTGGDYWTKTLALEAPKNISAADNEATTVYPRYHHP